MNKIMELIFNFLHPEFYKDLHWTILLTLMILGLVALVYGSKLLLLGASNIARMFHISEYAIGATIVGWSTSMPELFVSVDSAAKGLGVISLGNVIGSNLYNVILIFTILCVFSKELFRIKLPTISFLILLQLALFIIAYLGIDPIDKKIGIPLLVGLAIYTYVLLKHPHETEKVDLREEKHAKIQSKFLLVIISILYILLSIVLLFLGTEVFLNSVRLLGNKIGISEVVVGVLFVAVGTSLPELIVTILAVISMHDKKKTQTEIIQIQDVAEGNIIGSNIFNILGVLGASAVLYPISGIKQIVFDSFAMFLASVILLLLLIQKKPVQKLTGVLLLIFLVIDLIIIL